MPELPDIVVYLEALERRVAGRTLERIRIAHPFFLRSVDPPAAALEGCRVRRLFRLGKRIVFELDSEHYAVLHLMIAGRLRWKEARAKLPGKIGLAAFDFPEGSLVITEAGSKKRASLHLVRGAAALAGHDRGGLEVLDADLVAFRAALSHERHTLKRTLTDPRLFAGIGNAYSDEILHRARLSPFQLSDRLTDDASERLYRSCHDVLHTWTARLRQLAGDGFPENVTAFREGMAVHGRFRQPCPDCGSPIQRIVYAQNEANYCASCQTGGKLLADRALSRLLGADWPRTLEELESRRNPDATSE